ncbi:16495_t:CDS:2 [Entrophospora sp. SA101]|nr:16495_t:CDS:2 [Entrophospora sp. SA101]
MEMYYDWAGREGEAKYSESLNPNWHPGAGCHNLIKKGHSEHLVDDIYRKIMYDESPKKTTAKQTSQQQTYTQGFQMGSR